MSSTMYPAQFQGLAVVQGEGAEVDFFLNPKYWEERTVSENGVSVKRIDAREVKFLIRNGTHEKPFRHNVKPGEAVQVPRYYRYAIPQVAPQLHLLDDDGTVLDYNAGEKVWERPGIDRIEERHVTVLSIPRQAPSAAALPKRKPSVAARLEPNVPQKDAEIGDAGPGAPDDEGMFAGNLAAASGDDPVVAAALHEEAARKAASGGDNRPTKARK